MASERPSALLHSRTGLPRVATLGFGAAFLALTAIVLFAAAAIPLQRRANRWIDHTLTVLQTLQRFSHQLEDAQSEAWLATLSPRLPTTTLDERLRQVRDTAQRLDGLVADDPVQRERLHTLVPELNAALEDLRTGDGPDRLGAPAHLAHLAKVGELINALRAEELRLLAEREDHVRSQGLAFEGVIGLGCLTLFVLLGLALVASRRELRRRAELTEFQSRLTGIITHDLRSPLAAILATATHLDRAPQATAEAKLRRIIGSARRIDRLLGLLTAFTSMRLGGDVELNPERVELAQAARLAIAQVSHAHPKADLELRVERNSAGDWDRLLLITAIATLVENAVLQSSPDSPLVVTVSATDRHALLRVDAPTAILAADERERLFDPSVTPEIQPETVRYSASLGFYVSREILTAHRGALELATLTGKGTSFVIRLPRVADEPDVEVREPAAARVRRA